MWRPVLNCLLVMGGSSLLLADAPKSESKEPAIRVECFGKLRHGVVAIGGETTGSTLKFEGVSWELNLPDEASRDFARKYHKQSVFVVGSLRKVTGTAISERWIVDVDRLTPPTKDAPMEQALLKITGRLRKSETSPQSSATLAIEADGIVWPLDLTGEQSLQTRAESMVGLSAVLEGRLVSALTEKSPLKTVIRVKKLDAVPAKPPSR